MAPLLGGPCITKMQLRYSLQRAYYLKNVHEGASLSWVAIFKVFLLSVLCTVKIALFIKDCKKELISCTMLILFLLFEPRGVTEHNRVLRACFPTIKMVKLRL